MSNSKLGPIAKKILKESSAENLIIIDIQPGHKGSLHLTKTLVKRVLKANTVLWVFNDKELGYDSEEEMEDFILDLFGKHPRNIRLMSKQYGWCRGLMDTEGYDFTVEVMKKMIKFKVGDSRDLPGSEDMVESISLPPENLIEYAKRIPNPVLVGGGRDECLREVELSFDAYDIKYTTDESLVYE